MPTKQLFLCLLVVVALAMGCAAAPTPTPTATAMPTATPTSTPVPTATPNTTATAVTRERDAQRTIQTQVFAQKARGVFEPDIAARIAKSLGMALEENIPVFQYTRYLEAFGGSMLGSYYYKRTPGKLQLMLEFREFVKSYYPSYYKGKDFEITGYDR